VSGSVATVPARASAGARALSRLRPARNRPPAVPLTGKERWGRRALLAPALIYTIVVTQIPFLVTLFYSLHSWNLLRGSEREWIGLGNYTDFFRDARFREAALNTIVLTAASVFIAMAIGIALALLLDRKFLGRGVVRTLLISPFLIMPAAAALLWKNPMFDPVFGLLNFVLGPFGAGETDWISQHPKGAIITVAVWQWTPFMMLIVLAGLQGQDRDVLNAARTDGASPGRIFRTLTFPHLRPYIELGLVLGTIFLVQQFDAIFMITQGGPGTATTNIPYFLYVETFRRFEIGQAAALAVVVVIFTIVIASFALRVISNLFSDEAMEAR
jgi:sorbitol/mannitol transport system permease protein